MKRSFALFLLLSINFTLVFFFWQNQTTRADQTGPIPQNAIRLRILANSDSAADQVVKDQVRDQVNQNISRWVKNLKTRQQAETAIRTHLPELKQIIATTLQETHADPSYKIKLGHAYFPTKMYGSYVYPAGKYDALVITLGSGQGANWWCVLFPPLCFLDFSNSEAVRPQNLPQIKVPQNNHKAAAHARSQSKKSEKRVHHHTGKSAVSKLKASEAKAQADEKQQNSEQGSALPQTQKVHVHFLVVDLFSKLWDMIKG